MWGRLWWPGRVSEPLGVCLSAGWEESEAVAEAGADQEHNKFPSAARLRLEVAGVARAV